MHSVEIVLGENHPWCASFINYCLKESGYSVSGSASSQPFSNNKNNFLMSHIIDERLNSIG